MLVNGEEVQAELEKGYFTINRRWKKGDVVSLHLDMEPRIVRANHNVKADEGRIAIEKGPVVYCAEWPDNDFSVRSVIMSQKPELSVEHRSDLLYGIDMIHSDAQTIAYDEKGRLVVKDVTLNLIPYYAWCHRGSGEMTVWLPQELRVTKPLMPENLASKSKVSVSRRGSSLSAINDRLVPAYAEDRSAPYFHWWPAKNSTEWISYEFPQTTTVSTSTVYWFDDQPWGGCKVPDSWKIYYRNSAGEWVEVEALGAYPREKGIASEVSFKPVSTDAVKIEIVQPEEYSCGLFEWDIK